MEPPLLWSWNWGIKRERGDNVIMMRTGSEQATKRRETLHDVWKKEEEEESKDNQISYLDLGAEERGADLKPELPPTRPPLRAASAASTGTRKRVAAAKAAAASVADFCFVAPSSFFDAETITVRRTGRRGRALACTGARRATECVEAVILAAEGARSVCMRKRKKEGRKKKERHSGGEERRNYRKGIVCKLGFSIAEEKKKLVDKLR